MARRVDLAIATRGPVDVQVGASGSVQLRYVASRYAASPLTARRAAQLTVRRTAQPAVQRSARVFAEAPLLQAQRANSNVRSGYGWEKAMGGANVELRGRLTQLWSRLATGGAPQTTNFATQAQSAERGKRRFVARRR